MCRDENVRKESVVGGRGPRSNREKTTELECFKSGERRGNVNKLGFRPGFWKWGLCWRQEAVSHG